MPKLTEARMLVKIPLSPDAGWGTEPEQLEEFVRHILMVACTWGVPEVKLITKEEEA